MSVTNRTGDTTTFGDHHKPVLLALDHVGGNEFAIRYSCKDRDTFYDIKDVIMSFDRSERRWDPDECNGKGAWVVDEVVLDELQRYFPSIPAWLKKASQPTPGKAADVAANINIHECPF